MGLEERASKAMKNGEVTKVPCGSKSAVLSKIEKGEADAMSVSDPVQVGELSVMSHYAVRFNDRELGEAVRKLVMRGFGLS